MKTHEQVVEAISKAGTRMAWDWNTVSGDTFPEKYESVYVKLVEMTSVLIRKGLKGYFWVVCDSIMGELFEKWNFVFSTFITILCYWQCSIIHCPHCIFNLFSIFFWDVFSVHR